MAVGRQRRNKKSRVVGQDLSSKTRGLVSKTPDSEATQSSADVISAEVRITSAETENIVSEMSEQEVEDAKSIITSRYTQAQPITDAIREKMNNWEKQYQAQWRDPEHEDQEHIYVGKTREMVQIVHAFLVQLVSQLPSLVEFQPMLSKNLQALDEEWGRAKIAEALVNFYFDDLWKFRVDILPVFIKTFLKYSLAIIRVSYVDDAERPDLKFEVVDRAFQYIDPYCHDAREAGWWIEKTFLPLTEVENNFETGVWHRPKEFEGATPNTGMDSVDTETWKRFLGDRYNSSAALPEDELVEVWYYYQAAIKGRDHQFATIVGGENGWLVWFGPNPWPYKGIPYRAKSYDPHEWQVDGSPLVELFRHVQEMFNTIINIRLDDARKHAISPVFIPESWVNDKTQEDLESQQKFVRLSDEVVSYIMSQQGDLRKGIINLPVNTSSETLFQDMQVLIGLGKELSHTGDVFRGQAPQKQATLGEIQEVLNRNQGVFKPVFMQIMRLMEELAEIALEYFKDPDFFGEERIFAVIGKDRYAEDIKTWHLERGSTGIRRVSPDEMDVDVTINAVNAADAMMARTFRITSIQQLLGAMGQVPGLFEEIREDYKWSGIIDDIFNMSVSDISSFKRSDEEKARRAQEKEQAQQKQIATSARMVQLSEGAKAQAQAKGKIAVVQAEVGLAGKQQLFEIQAQKEVDMEVDINKIAAKNASEIDQIRLEFQQEIRKSRMESRMELQQDLAKMQQEFILEMKALQMGKKVSIGSGSNNINQ